MKKIYLMSLVFWASINAAHPPRHRTPTPLLTCLQSCTPEWIKDCSFAIQVARKSDDIRNICDATSCVAGTACICQTTYPCCCLCGVALVTAYTYNHKQNLTGPFRDLVYTQPTSNNKSK